MVCNMGTSKYSKKYMGVGGGRCRAFYQSQRVILSYTYFVEMSKEQKANCKKRVILSEHNVELIQVTHNVFKWCDFTAFTVFYVAEFILIFYEVCNHLF